MRKPNQKPLLTVVKGFSLNKTHTIKEYLLKTLTESFIICSACMMMNINMTKPMKKTIGLTCKRKFQSGLFCLVYNEHSD